MQKRSLIRLMMIVTLATLSILVLAAVRPHNHHSTIKEDDCPGSNEKCDRNRTQGEFIIWESLSRTILASTR